jgi:hypothetical protein
LFHYHRVSENIFCNRTDQYKQNFFVLLIRRRRRIMECWNCGMMGKKTMRKPFLYPIFQHSTIPSFHAADKIDDRIKNKIPYIAKMPKR